MHYTDFDNKWYLKSSKLLTSFASMTVPTPTVSDMVGTFDRSISVVNLRKGQTGAHKNI